MTKVRATRHNGRSGKKGIFTTKHNDRNFDLANADHIDASRTHLNAYWDYVNGLRTGDQRAYEDENGQIPSFADAEKAFYEERYRNFIQGQNERNAKSRHTERNRTAEQILQDKRFCPEESIYQFGEKGGGATGEQLMAIVTEFKAAFEQRYGSHVHIIDWALHMDETTPHIQERHCFDYINKYGEIEPKQERALEQLGIPLPHPGEKQSCFNCRKITFDAACRELLIDIAKTHGLDVEETVKYGGKAHREKTDMVIASQQEALAEQEQRISSNEERIADQLTQISQQDALLDKVSEIAYDKAVTVVTEQVIAETQKADLAVIESVRQKAASPERGLKKEVLDWINRCTDAAIGKIQKSASKLRTSLIALLTKPERRSEGLRKTKEASRQSIRDALQTATTHHAKSPSRTDETTR